MKGEGQGQGQIFPTVAAKKNAVASATQFLLNFASFAQAKSEWNSRSRIRPKVNLVQLLRIWFCVPFLSSVLSEKNKLAKTDADLFKDSQTKNVRLYLDILNCLDTELGKKRSVVLTCCHTLPLRYRSAIQPRRKERSSAQ
jgi:hypothetical protein